MAFDENMNFGMLYTTVFTGIERTVSGRTASQTSESMIGKMLPLNAFRYPRSTSVSISSIGVFGFCGIVKTICSGCLSGPFPSSSSPLGPLTFCAAPHSKPRSLHNLHGSSILSYSHYILASQSKKIPFASIFDIDDIFFDLVVHRDCFLELLV
jgi:hypothetical protein